MSALPMSSFSSWFFLILQIPFSSCTGPKKSHLNKIDKNYFTFVNEHVIVYVSMHSFGYGIYITSIIRRRWIGNGTWIWSGKTGRVGCHKARVVTWIR
jgi:hypothetical protein